MRGFSRRIVVARRACAGRESCAKAPCIGAAPQQIAAVSGPSAAPRTGAPFPTLHLDRVLRSRACASAQAQASLRQLQRVCGNRQVQRLIKASTASEPTVPDAVHDVIRSSGEPLESATRSFMESRFARVLGGSGSIGRMAGADGSRRCDFGDVRVHTDGRAAASARVMNARAYAVGHHLVFDSGAYAPGTAAGNELLAHELAHVAQQTGGGRAASAPRIQGKWRLDSVTPVTGASASTQGNGSTKKLVIAEPGPIGMMLTKASTWQETGILHQQVGGEAQIVNWLTKHFVFKRDGEDGEILQLKWDASLMGSAKSDDLYHARASSMIWGRVTERTAADPTPADRELFSIKDGGISASTIGDLGEVEAEMPLPKGGGVKVRIPLKKVDEGRPAPFDEGSHQLYAVPPSVDQVDVFMAARSSADAYIETALTGLAPWLSRNWNDSNAFASFLLGWKSVAVGSGGTGGQAGAAAVVAGVPTCGRDPLQTPVGTVVPTKGKYAGKTIRYADRRGKHTKVASCALVDLTAALATEPARLLGELRKFVEACKARDTAYGSQLSAEGQAQYRELMLSALENGNPDESFRTKAPNKIGMRIGGSGCTATDFYVVKDDAVGPKAEFHLHPAA